MRLLFEAVNVDVFIDLHRKFVGDMNGSENIILRAELRDRVDSTIITGVYVMIFADAFNRIRSTE